MSTNHNRIKVADLEKNEADKILLTNVSGELEFKEINQINYNALDYTLTNKALDARQGKALKDLIDDINEALASDNVDLDTVQKLADAIETIQNSLNSILVNDLTTGGTTKALTAEMGKLLQTNKVDKVSGERLINAAEITKLSGLSNTNITTTVKTILSSVLATQNVAGFVAYINALNPVLVVGNNEIVKYTTSDTGRTFELNLRGRSFGVGQPAIVAANVTEITEFLNKDVRLSNYPNTRNDGQIPTNKVLGTDANGNLKLYTIATLPAPNLREISPGFYLPSTTGNITIRGSFFTPSMTVSITGQTVNYVTFISDNEVHVNVTTGVAEGLFSVTLNNGLSATFNNILSIVLGTVFTPAESEWTKTGQIAFTDGTAITTVYNSIGTGVWSKNIDYTKNFRIEFKMRRSPLGITNELANENNYISLIKSSDYSRIISFLPYVTSGINRHGLAIKKGAAATEIYFYWYNYPNMPDAYSAMENMVVSLRWINGVMYVYVNGILRSTLAETINEVGKIKVSVGYSDYINIKYIETA